MSRYGAVKNFSPELSMTCESLIVSVPVRSFDTSAMRLENG